MLKIICLCFSITILTGCIDMEDKKIRDYIESQNGFFLKLSGGNEVAIWFETYIHPIGEVEVQQLAKRHYTDKDGWGNIYYESENIHDTYKYLSVLDATQAGEWVFVLWSEWNTDPNYLYTNSFHIDGGAWDSYATHPLGFGDHGVTEASIQGDNDGNVAVLFGFLENDNCQGACIGVTQVAYYRTARDEWQKNRYLSRLTDPNASVWTPAGDAGMFMNTRGAITVAWTEQPTTDELLDLKVATFKSDTWSSSTTVSTGIPLFITQSYHIPYVDPKVAMSRSGKATVVWLQESVQPGDGGIVLAEDCQSELHLAVWAAHYDKNVWGKASQISNPEDRVHGHAVTYLNGEPVITWEVEEKKCQN